MNSFPERLARRVGDCRSALCVGLDPRPDLIPLPPTSEELSPRRALCAQVERIELFSAAVLDAVEDIIAVVKPQIAFFERFGAPGMAAFERICRSARRRGLLVIADAKRSDIASTATAYAEGFLGAAWHGELIADALTVNPFLGADGIQPFVEKAVATGTGLFVLVKTSNPGSADLQDLVTADGRVYERTAALVRRLEPLEEGRYGLVGAVVGATHAALIPVMRRQLPRSWMLLPGVGAQGGSLSDAAAAFDRDGLGALVNVSRSVLYPWLAQSLEAPAQWHEAIRAAVLAECCALDEALAGGAR